MSKKLSISASSMRFDADHVRARRQPGHRELPVGAQREVADHLAARRVEHHDVRAEDPRAVLRDAARDAAGVAAEMVRRIEIGDARDIVRLQRPHRDVAGPEGDRKHHGGDADRMPLPRGALRFTQRRVAEPAEMADLVKRDRLQIPLVRLAGFRHRPREGRIEEDVGLEELAGRVVHQVTGRGEHAIERRLAQEPERRPPVVLRPAGWPCSRRRCTTRSRSAPPPTWRTRAPPRPETAWR